MTGLTEQEKKNRLALAGIIALGIALGGFLPGRYYYRAKAFDRTVTVKGLAEREVKADMAVWNLRIIRTGGNLESLRDKLKADQKAAVKFLADGGLQQDEIMTGRLETNDLMANPYRSDKIGADNRYILKQTITVRTGKVDAIEKLVGRTDELLKKGVIFDGESYPPSVSYLFTKLNDVKPEMIKEATASAKEAAEEFARNSGSRVGEIKSASQGQFSILPLYQTPDAQESQQKEKKVRVVSTLEYYLE
ncbi:MAG TPA: SIMPL domain-containing protein [Elusimicrobiales bacterium]|nr:SIMPL domain-containing protein [Elusimicrobiales bacterium]